MTKPRRYTRFNDIPPFTKSAQYQVNQSWKYMQDWIDDQSEIGLDLDPVFQREHVWTEEQQIRYVEFRLRRGGSGRDIYFNHPGWNSGDYDRGPFVLVDGKQRLNAVFRFLRNEIPVFGTFFEDYEDKQMLRAHTADFIIHINDLQTVAEVYQWYIDLNRGGVCHTDEEIRKVEILLNEELRKQNT